MVHEDRNPNNRVPSFFFILMTESMHPEDARAHTRKLMTCNAH